MGISLSSQTRREALAGMARLAGGTLLSQGFLAKSALSGPAGYNPILSVQTYIWVQRFQSQNKALADGVQEMLAGIRSAGFRRVELIADFLKPDVRDKTLALLEGNGLQMPTLYASSTLHEAEPAERSVADIVELAQAVKGSGLRAIVTNPSPKPNQGRKSDAELDTQARYLNRLGGELQKRGMRLLVHHHIPELLENAREWRHQSQHTDPKLVRCCVDVEWAHRGGQEPLSFLREVGTRLASLHLRNSEGGVWLEDFGAGDIDYEKVADYLKQIRYDGYLVVELAYEKDTKITRPLEENLRLSRLYAEKVFGL